MDTRLTPADVLLNAANLIHRHGWITRSVGSYLTGFCTVGAVWNAGGGFGSTVSSVALSYLGATLGRTDFAAWNDHECTGAKELITVLKKAAELARQAEIRAEELEKQYESELQLQEA